MLKDVRVQLVLQKVSKFYTRLRPHKQAEATLGTNTRDRCVTVTFAKRGRARVVAFYFDGKVRLWDGTAWRPLVSVADAVARVAEWK